MGVCIVNGWYSGGYFNDYIFNGVCGFSIIDYLLIIYDMFDFISKFIVCNFIIFLDYVLLYIEFKCIILLDFCDMFSYYRIWNVFRWDFFYVDLCNDFF